MWTGRRGCCRGDDADKPDAGEVSRYNIRRGIEGSLERLQVDCIDLYQLHWPARYVPMFGRSRFNPEEVRPAPDFDVVVKVCTSATLASPKTNGKKNHQTSRQTQTGIIHISARSTAGPQTRGPP